MFILRKIICLHDTDAAGRVYFANQFRLAHEAYEGFLAALGFPLADLLQSARFGLPIVHAEADYKAPLSVGDELDIAVKPLRVGVTSFTLLSRITRAGRTVGRVTTVHVAVDAKRGTKRPLPARLRAALIKSM
jgi:YbgC/YbaW family acyl-CoA thioester hydrolase